MSINLTNEVDHDHRVVFRMMQEIERLVAVPDRMSVRDELLDALSALLDDALDHFAREEAWLFPALREQSPSFDAPITELERGHDALAGVAQRMIHMVTVPSAEHGQLGLLAQRLKREYEEHVVAEHKLLEDAAKTLTPEQRRALAMLMHRD